MKMFQSVQFISIYVAFTKKTKQIIKCIITLIYDFLFTKVQKILIHHYYHKHFILGFTTCSVVALHAFYFILMYTVNQDYN